MAKLQAIVSDNLDKKFRDVVYNRSGLRKGDISKAVEEAIKLWIDSKESK